MSKQQIIDILRKYMGEYEVPFKVRSVLCWYIARLFKEMDDESELS